MSIDGTRVSFGPDDILSQRAFASRVYNATAKSGDGVKIWAALAEPKFKELLRQWTENATEMLPIPGSDLHSTIAAEIKAMIAAKKYTAGNVEHGYKKKGRVFHDTDARRYYFQARTLRQWLKAQGVRASSAETSNAFQELGGYGSRDTTVKIDGIPEHPWTLDESTVEGWRT